MTGRDNMLVLNDRKIAFGDLSLLSTDGLANHERAVISFCRDWIMGASLFEARTSGSTGSPKTIRLRREQMTASALLTQKALDLKEGMTAWLCLDPELIAGKMMMVRSMVTGMHLAVTEPVSIPLDHIPANTTIDFAAMVPLQVISTIDSGRHPDFEKIGTVIIGGGPVSDSLKASLQVLETKFFATFGMTETLSHVALQRLNGAASASYFEALPGITFSTDHRGCLAIHATYLGKEPIITNDLVDLLTSTKFMWRGRWDNVINSGGIKVVPEDVEREVTQTFIKRGITNRFFVTSVNHSTLGQQVALIVEGFLDDQIEKLVLQELRTSLDKYKTPRTVLYAEKFAVTAMGKIQRRESAASASPRPGH